MTTRYRTEHGHPVEIFDNGEGTDGDRYYWFEYVDGHGSTFKERVRDVRKYVAIDEWEPLD